MTQPENQIFAFCHRMGKSRIAPSRLDCGVYVIFNVEEAGGKNAASRLALVRAAAEMGRAMPVTDEEAIATGLVKWFAEWELIIPQDARAKFHPVYEQARAAIAKAGVPT